MSLNFLQSLYRKSSKYNHSSDEFDDELPTDSYKYTKLGFIFLGIGFGGFILWATLAPLDEGVPAQATVSVDTKRKPIQHLSGGTVAEVNVREGQWVEKDQLLLRMNSLVATANYQNLRKQYYSHRAMEGRLLAEQLGGPIRFSSDLIEEAKNDPEIQQLTQVQLQLLSSKRQSLAANIRSLEESIRGQEALISGYNEMAQNRKNQYGLYQDELDRAKDLIKEGYLPLNKQSELQRSMAEAANYQAEAISNMQRARQAILDMRQRIIAIRSDYNKEVESALAEVRRDVGPEEDKMRAAKRELDATQLKAPVSGQVVGLTIQTVGAVVQAGQKIMDIVPKDEQLMLEAKIQPHLIDRVKVGDPVDVRFNSFSHTPQLRIDGVIDSLSADIILDPQSQIPPYYLARIRVTENGIKKLGGRQMQAGMPAEVVVKTGTRTFMSYILNPLIKRMAASMKEE